MTCLVEEATLVAKVGMELSNIMHDVKARVTKFSLLGVGVFLALLAWLDT
jgi:hypothetical protein